MRYLEATLLDGTTVTGEFSRLANMGRYVSQVFSGQKPFNAWRTVSDVLPSGEKAATRSRVMLAGSQIASIREVDAVGQTVTEIARGPRGRWTAPAGIDGVTEGTVFPKHRDNSTLRDYVILAAAAEGTSELQKRLYLDYNEITEVDPSAVPALPDGDDDDDGERDEY